MLSRNFIASWQPRWCVLLPVLALVLMPTQLGRAQTHLAYPNTDQVEIDYPAESSEPIALFDGDTLAGGCYGAGCQACGDDWHWGCGGSPNRTGPGRCDDWRVGPMWDVVVDGLGR